jgi:O-antigen/teichoic acid export membrane protein
MAVGGFLLSNQLILALLGTEYLPAADALAVLAWTLPIWFITFLQGNLLTIIERQKAVAAVGFVNMTANVVLNLLVIPRYGFTGAAVTTLITEVIGMSQMFYLLRNNISLKNTVMTVIRVALLSSVMGVAIYLLRDHIHVFATIAITATGYMAAAVLMKILPLEEIRSILVRRTEMADAGGIQPPASGP